MLDNEDLQDTCLFLCLYSLVTRVFWWMLKMIRAQNCSLSQATDFKRIQGDLLSTEIWDPKLGLQLPRQFPNCTVQRALTPNLEILEAGKQCSWSPHLLQHEVIILWNVFFMALLPLTHALHLVQLLGFFKQTPSALKRRG